MTFISWSENLSVKIEEVDKQHMQLVNMINALHESMKKGEGADLLGELLSSLVAFAQTHFDTEEKYMTQYKFPGYIEHKREHEKFKNEAIELQQKHKSGEIFLTLEVSDLLSKWLKDHLMTMDMKYVDFFQDKGLS